MGSQATSSLLCASIMLSSASLCLAQEMTPKLEGWEPRPAGPPGNRLPRLAVFEYRALTPIRWDFTIPPHPEATFSSTGPLDLLFGAPDALVGGAMHALSRLSHDEGDFDMREESQRSMAVRLTGAIDVGPIDHPFESFMGLLYDRESKYFSRWQESSLATSAVQDGSDDVDGRKFMREQNKVFVHALGRRYLGRYGDFIGQNLSREAFDFSRWDSTDFVVGPALISGYLYLRGWDGRLRFGDVDCRIHLLPVERIGKHFQKSDDILVSAASLELAVPEFPLRAIVSCGVVDGRPVFDFIGLGTSIGMVRKTIKLEVDPAEADR